MSTLSTTSSTHDLHQNLKLWAIQLSLCHLLRGSSQSTERCGRNQNLIWFHERILVLKCVMKRPFHERMPLNFHDFLWIFQNLESISMTFPSLEKNNEIPWLFQVFHDWIHPVKTTYSILFVTPSTLLDTLWQIVGKVEETSTCAHSFQGSVL